MPHVGIRAPRIFYVGMVSTQAYVTAIGQDAFVGAAAGKMSAVTSALRLAGRRAFLVSLPFVTQGPARQRGRMCHTDGFPAYFVPIRRQAVARKFFGAFALAWFASGMVRRQDTVLFYNHAIEYILALIILRIRRIAVFQDIEDVPTLADSGLRGKANGLGYRVMSALASQRKVTVSNQVGRILGLSDFKAVQGVAAQNTQVSGNTRWESLDAGLPLRVHFGGTLVASTGLDLFCSAIARLDSTAFKLDRDITFVLTGTGEFDPIESTAQNLKSDRLSLEIHREIRRSEYFDLLDSCHASLSLRKPNSEIADTTFPSKVIEITSRGLALISSRVSDIDEIFANDEAWLLTDFSSTDLTEILMHMAAHPHQVRQRAAAGMARARELFDPLAVGLSLAAFLEAGPSQS